jgi:hypothetical protein
VQNRERPLLANPSLDFQSRFRFLVGSVQYRGSLIESGIEFSQGVGVAQGGIIAQGSLDLRGECTAPSERALPSSPIEGFQIRPIHVGPLPF